MPALTRIQLGAAGFALLAGLGWLLRALLLAPEIPYLTDHRVAPWIAPFAALDANAVQVDREQVPARVLVRRFELEAPPARAILRFRALAEAQVELNDTALPADAEVSWRRWREHEVGHLLEPGPNELRVRVRNPRGPPLLQLALEGGDGDAPPLVTSDAAWLVLDRAGPLPTMLADDTRAHPQSYELPASGTRLAERAGSLALLFALSVLLALAMPRLGVGARAGGLALAAVALFWLFVYARKTAALPVVMGFDIGAHLAYVELLLGGRLPLATDGWSTYHPPFAHALLAGLRAASGLDWQAPGAGWLYRLPGTLAGLGNVAVVYLLARRLFDGDPLRTALAVGFAGLLPMNVYMAAYLGNEPVHAFLVSASLCVACGLLLEDETSPARLAALAGLLGLAVLTKFTAWIAVVGVVAALLARGLASMRPLGRAAGEAGGVLAGVLAVGGWFYLRNWLHFGRPFVGNWDLPGRMGWWEQPGFHTADYYLRFGEALRHPFFAGYQSFWDGVYSTFWGDGLVAGMIRVATRHEAWRYDFMTAGYWLAFPATLLILAGVVRVASWALGTGAPERRLAWSLLLGVLATLGFALLAITLRLPYYAQAKAFYVLAGVAPLSLAAAAGLAWIPERLGAGWQPVRLAYWGWLGTLALCIALSFAG